MLDTFVGKYHENWMVSINKTGQTIFFDELFKILKEQYTEYLFCKRQDKISKNFIDSLTFYPLKQAVIKYVIDKCNIQDIRHFKLNYGTILEFIYFGKVICVISHNYHDHDLKDIKIDDTIYKWNYFMWTREGDPNNEIAPENLSITSDNFSRYTVSFTKGWRSNQLKTFFYTVILPDILKQANINININHPEYKNVLIGNKKSIGEVIRSFLDNKLKLDSNCLSEVNKFVENLELNIDSDTSLFWSEYLKNENLQSIIRGCPHKMAYENILLLKSIQKVIQLRLKEKLQMVKENIDQRKHKDKIYKWQLICSKLQTIDLQDLYELAIIEGIPHYSMMTKRELCGEFSKKLEDAVRSKKQSENRCENRESFLTSDNVEDIRPEFFFTYRHNGHIYCDDIRAIHKFINQPSTKNRHPIDRMQLSDNVIRNINREYEFFQYKTLPIKEEDEEESMSIQSLLSSKTTNLLSKLIHPNSASLFINCDESLFFLFLNNLLLEHVISANQIRHIVNQPSLINKKILLVDLLILQIDNDQNVYDGVSQISTIVSEEYNKIFQREEPMEII